MRDDTIVRFERITYEYGPLKSILDEASFSVRRSSKITLMGQNGAGKSTIFKLITGMEEPEAGSIHISPRTTIATARQVIPRSEMKHTVREFFEHVFTKKMYDIDVRIIRILQVVNIKANSEILDRTVESFSGGQQARLLLASALIQDPDVLLLDEPTNNLDTEGIAHLTDFLIEYKKTVIVISHDAKFLNSFTQGVLYLDVHTHKVENYVGNYSDVLVEIGARMEKENMKNAQLAKTAIANKEKANYFAHKGGQLRLVAKRMRAKAEEAESSMVDVRREDKTIKRFSIPAQEDLSGEIVTIRSYTTQKDGASKTHKKTIALKKNQHLLLRGPNGIGKSTLLESIAHGTSKGVSVAEGVRIGYYRQDFSNLDFDSTVYQELASVMKVETEQHLRATAAAFLLTEELIHQKIGHLSEGQKGLVAFARLVLLRPGLLILDEPTNHINFRHIPVIAAAVSMYQGAMILVSHVPSFVASVRIDETLDLTK
jgi:ATP-binding cassette subfamily F protein 3